MQQFVGEEKNDLLDYLRSLQPEKVCVKIAEAIFQLVGYICLTFRLSLTILTILLTGS